MVICGHPCYTYRLGDIVSGYLKNPTYICKNWSTSVGCKFIQNGRKDLCTLIDNIRTPKYNFVIHLRLGDVLDWPYYNPAKSCGQKTCYYTNSYDFYKNIEIPPFVKNITIVGNPSYRIINGRNTLSKKYLQNVYNILQKRNMTVHFVHHEDADIDIAIMLHAVFLCPVKEDFLRSLSSVLVINHPIYSNKINGGRCPKIKQLLGRIDDE